MAGQIIKRSDKTWMVRIFNGRDGKGKRRWRRQNEATLEAGAEYRNLDLVFATLEG